MTLEACAEIVRRGDPDRFLAAMAAPAPTRKTLFSLYAFNVEVSRAPWVSREPLIVEMRLQWWRDALEEIARGAAVRRHEVTLPLAEVLDREGARLLDALVEARRADVQPAPFADAPSLSAYLDATGGNLAWTAARALGAEDEEPVRDIAWAGALAAYLRAVPRLAALGREPLPPGTDLAALAKGGLARLARGRARRDRRALPALLPAWQAEGILCRAHHQPETVAQDALAPSEFVRRLTLIRAAATGRV